MKKVIFILALLLTVIPLSAQRRISFSVELEAGAGVWKGPLFTVSPEFVAQYGFSNGISVGAGAGVRYSMPCLQYITTNGTPRRKFINENDIPVFLRVGYSKNMFFANLDGGYAIGVYSFYGKDWTPGGKTESKYNGFFIRPHAGLNLGRGHSLSLGVLLQQSTVKNQVSSTTAESATSVVTTEHHLTPAITLRYGFTF